MFKSLSFPHEHLYLLAPLRTHFDKLFFDVYEADRPILNSKTILKDQNVQLNALKEIYSVDRDNLLRFDHTHILRSDFKQLNEKNIGHVFRKEPTTRNRWRQFNQYDVDYVYENHSYRPLKKLLKFLGPSFKVKLNDLNLFNSHKDLSKEHYVKLFMKKYPDLPKENIDPAFGRGWTYYEGLVFEINHPLFKESLVGGGTYKIQEDLMFGFSIGLNRLIKLCSKDPLLHQRFFPLEKLVLIRYDTRIPENLLDRLEFQNIPYHLIKKKGKLIKDYKKAVQSMEKVNRSIELTITVSETEDLNQQYFYRPKGALEPKPYSLDELVKVFRVYVA